MKSYVTGCQTNLAINDPMSVLSHLFICTIMGCDCDYSIYTSKYMKI
jgi:hypothetical protein